MGRSFAVRFAFGSFCLFLASTALATNFTSTQSGSWSSAATWGGAGVPGGTDNATVSAGTTVTLTSPTIINDLSVSGGTLDLQTNSLSVNASLTFGSGTITGSGTLTVANNFNWSAGAGVSSTSIVMPLGSATNILSNGSHLLNGASLTSSGTMTMTGPLTTRSGGSFSNQSSGTVDIQGDYQLGWDGNGGTGTITNAGSITKSSGSGAVLLGTGATFNDSGTITSSSGTLNITSAATCSGSPLFTAGSGAILQLTGNGSSFPTGTSFSGAGQVLIGNNSTFNGTINVTVSTFGLESGTQTFVAASLSGTMQWDSAVLSGTLAIPSGSTLQVKNSSGTHLISGGTISSDGLIDLIAASVATRNGSTIANSATGAINLEGDFSIGWDGNGGTGSITNDGVLTKVSGTGTSALGNSSAISGAGTYHAQTGTLRFSAATAASAATVFNADSGTTIEFITSGNTFASGMTFSGSGAYRLAADSTFSAGSITVAGGLTLDSGTITFNGLTVNGTITWNNAIIAGSGLSIPLSSTINVSSAGTHLLNGGVITNSGTINANSDGIHLRSASSITNNSGANVNLAADFTFGWDGNGGVGTIVNDGTITKSGGTGTTNLGNGAAISGGGTYHTQSGTLQFASATTTSVTTIFNADSSTTIKFTANGNSFANGTAFNGTGSYEIAAQSVFAGGSVTVAGNFTLTSGTITFNTYTFHGALTWNNANIDGTGLTIPSGSSLTITNASGTHLLNGGSITNGGTLSCSATCITTRNGGTFTNQTSGSVGIAGDYFFGYDGNGSAGTMSNAGTITKSAGTGTATIGNGPPFTNTSSITVLSGTLQISSPTANSAAGSFTIADGTTLTFSGSGNTFAGGTNFLTNGSGTGIVNVNNASTFTGSITSATPIVFGSGTITWSSATLNAAMTWNNATFTGSLTLPLTSSVMTATAGTHLLNGASIDNSAPWTLNSSVSQRSGGSFVNHSGTTVDIAGDYSFGWDGNGATAPITNDGTIKKSAGTGTIVLGNGDAIVNTNLIRVMSGIAQLSATDNSGTLQADSGASLILTTSGNSFQNGSILTGGGTIQSQNNTLWAGTLNVINPTTFNLAGGTQTFAAASLSGAANWSNGTIAGSGLTIPSGSSLTTTSGSSLLVDGGTIINNGTVTLSALGINYRNGGAFTNNSGALLNMLGNLGIGYDGNGAFPAITLNGTVRKSGGTGSSSFHCGGVCTVDGTLDVQTGTISFGSGVTFNSTATVATTITGATAGTGYGTVNSNSTTTLGGAITASVPGPFSPSGGQVFTVVTYPSASGTFTNSTIAFGSGRTFSVAKNAANVTLTASGPTLSTVNPSSGTQFGGTSVTITGTNFASGGSFGVMFGGTSATCNVDSATQITCTTPSHAAGTVDVVVTNGDGQSTTQTNAFTFTTGCYTLPSGAQAWWRAESNAVDDAGTHNGTLVGTPAFTAAKVGQGFTFDSDDDGVTIPHSTALDVNSPGFTVEFWMKGAHNQPQSLFLVIDKSHGWTDSTGWFVQGDSTTGIVSFAVGAGGAGTTNFVGINSTIDVLDSSLHHIAGVWDGALVKLYVDGVLQGSASLASPVNNTRSVNIGYSWGGGTPSRFFRGVMDEATVYGRALTAAEISNIDLAGNQGKCFSATAPSVSSFTPSSGGVGSSVTISGANFIGASAVKFNGTSTAIYTVDSASQITATVPTAATTGPISVTNAGGTGSSLANFTVTSADLAVTTSGPANVLPNASFSDSITVTNGGSDPATSATLHASASSGTITAISSSGPMSCTHTASTVDCSAATFAVGATAQVTVTITAPSSTGTTSLTATVSATNDTNGANDSSTVNVSVVNQTSSFVVTSNADSGANTLRRAIEDANSGVCGPICNVTFNLGAGNRTIALLSELPAVIVPITLDGTSEPGWAGAPLIDLNGASAGTGATGFYITGGSSIVRGFVFRNFDGAGIELNTNGLDTITGNYFGITPDGSAINANHHVDLFIDGVSNNTIGGTTANERNVISGSSTSGIGIENGAAFNVIIGNYIGTDPTGSASRGNNFNGVYILDSPNNTIGGTSIARRNVISANGSPNVLIGGASSTGNLVEGNYIGTNATGTAALANGSTGVTIYSGAHNNTVGGSAAGAGNVVSGNASDGIIIFDAGSTNNTVENNYAGLNAAGTAAIPNGFSGIAITNGAATNTIRGNVASGNTTHGIAILDSGSDFNVVQGNLVGLNPAGTAAIGNGWQGIAVFGTAKNNLIGGSSASSRNVASGNGINGIVIADGGTTGNGIQGNYAGTNAAGTAAIPNAFAGLAIFNGATGNFVGTTAANVLSGNTTNGILITDSGTTGNQIANNYIGTDAAGTGSIPNAIDGVRIDSLAGQNVIASGNTIAHNQRGIDLTGTAGLGNSFTSNSIFANSVIGIDLGADGVTANDATDSDSGPNGLQNFPALTNAHVVGTDLMVDVAVNSTGSVTTHAFIIDVYKADISAAQPQGKQYLGSSGCLAANPLSTTITIPGVSLIAGDNIIATATSYASNSCGAVGDGTSEFSPVASIASVSAASADLVLTAGVAPSSASVGGTLTFSAHVVNNGTSTANNVTITMSLPANVTATGATTATQGTCSVVSSTATCNIGTLANAATADVTVTTTANAGGSATATSNATANESDPNTANNTNVTATASITGSGTLVVTSNADSGAATLRQAILDANSHVCTSPCTIHFALPANALTIALNSALPAITAPVVIDGTTQSGYAGTPLVTVDGTLDTSNTAGLQLAGGSSTVRGLAIVHFHDVGVLVTSANNTVNANVISGNSGPGLRLDTTSSTSNTISNNKIGVNASATSAMPNNSDGIQILNGAGGITINANIISGNASSGIYFAHQNTAPLIAIKGNLIGTNAATNATIGNGGAGIYVDDGVPNLIIGGTTGTDSNIIGGNPFGIRVAGAGSPVHVFGNYIGTNGAQTIALANNIGIQLESFTDANVIGGDAAGQPNVIANSSGDGVIVYSTANEIIDNSIYANGNLGIELTPNANNNQPAPMITSASISGGNLVVNYNVSASAVTQSIRVDFFKADALGQGKKFLFSACIGSNNGSSTSSMNAAALGVTIGDKLVALATSINDPSCSLASPGDGTSQFSPAATVTCTTPSAQINAPASTCPNATGLAASIVNPTAGSSYNWSITNGTVTSGQGTTSITFNAGASGNTQISVAVTNGACSANGSATVNITPNTTPVVNAGGPTTFCAGGSVALSTSSTGTYLWSNGATTQSITVTASGNYSVTVTNGSCSATSTPVTVTVNPNPNANITVNGNSASVAAGPSGTTYTWSVTGGTITSGQGTNAITFNGGTSVSVTVNTSGCISTGTASVQSGADLALSMSASPNSVNGGAPLSFILTITNNGPSDATNVIVNDTLPSGATFNSASGAGWNCSSPVVCTTSLVGANSTTTITIDVTAPSQSTTLTNSASINSSTSDPNNANNSASASATVTQTTCGNIAPSLSAPADNASNLTSPVTFTWQSVLNAIGYELWLAVDDGTPTLVLTTAGTTATINVAGNKASWYVGAKFDNNCATVYSAPRTFTLAKAVNCDNHGVVTLVAPSANATLTSPVTFTWTSTPQAIGYRVWISIDGGAAQDVGATDGATSLTATIPAGSITWFVDALFAGCPPTHSSTRTFTVPAPDPCANRNAASLIAPANNATSQTSQIEFKWTAVANNSGYRLWASIDNAPFTVLGTTTNTTLTRTISSGHVAWYVETLFDGCSSLESEHRTFDVPKRQDCGTEVASLVAPTDNSTTTNANVTFSWNSVPQATTYEVWLSLNNAAASFLGSTTQTTLAKEVPAGSLEWFVRANFDGCDPRDSAKRHFTYSPPAACSDAHPVLIAPLNNTSTFAPVNFSWKEVAGATSYRLRTAVDGAPFTTLATTSATHVDDANVSTGAIDWIVEASFGNDCPSTTSSTSHFTVLAKPQGCVAPTAPTIFAPSTASSGITYTIRWQKVAGGASYLIQESQNGTFSDSNNESTDDDNADYSHTNNGNDPITFYYRVRALSNCSTQPGPYSSVVAIIILPSKPTGQTLTGALPSDQAQNISYTIQLDASLAGSSFSANVNEPWLTVTPSSGVIPAGGLTLTVTANTAGLPLGTSLGGVTISTNAPSAGSRATTKVTTNTTTVSVSLVQPVQPKPNSAPPPDALIIPAIAHADGINSKFQSDVRVTNTATQTMKYQVTFTPTGDNGAKDAKQTTIDVDPGKTVALDDILGTWFSSGAFKGQIGTLELRPLTQLASSVSTSNALANIATFASSRTFNATSNGTFGQYIPAIPFANFVGNTASVLSLQQIAQSQSYRTNLGLVEGSGNPVSVLLSVFGNDGKKITEFPMTLAAGQHTQFSLAQQNVNVSDGRVEVKVTSGTGRVTAYASVLDNLTNDPMLVSPVTITQSGATKFVIPGVADINNGLANWRTDTRIYNASSKTVTANLAFYSQFGGTPKTQQITLAPNEVKQLDNTLANVFGVTNDGGALHVSTTDPSNLITSARTYNQTTNGTYGQFINGITPADAAGAGGRALQVLQVEESDRYRSNIGIAEVNGKTATVELLLVPADGRVTGKLTFTLAPNEFRQFNLKEFGVGTTYNGRVSVRVTGGDGRITAYASVIDAITQDPTFVPAQ